MIGRRFIAQTGNVALGDIATLPVGAKLVVYGSSSNADDAFLRLQAGTKTLFNGALGLEAAAGVGPSPDRQFALCMYVIQPGQEEIMAQGTITAGTFDLMFQVEGPGF